MTKDDFAWKLLNLYSQFENDTRVFTEKYPNKSFEVFMEWLNDNK